MADDANWQQPTQRSKTLQYCDAECARIADELLGIWVKNTAGTRVPSVYYRLVQVMANAGATRGFIVGYNRALQDMAAGHQLVSLGLQDKELR